MKKTMNEDDTYRRLKRIPFSDLLTIYRDWLLYETMSLSEHFDFEKHGWTRLEFDDTLIGISNE